MVVFKAVYSVFYAYPTSWQVGLNCPSLPAGLGGTGEFEREFSLQRRVTYFVERYSSAGRNFLKWTNLLIYFLIRYFLRNQFVITIDTLFGRFVSQISIAPCGKILVT